MRNGVDIVKISRLEKQVQNEKFLNKYFSNYEKEYIDSKRINAVNTMAGLYACKEAVLKALGTGIGELSLKDCCVVHDGFGSPFVELNDKIIAVLFKNNCKEIKVSISHDGDYAIAFCTIV